ncbi:MAG: hypothetical protein ACYCVB_12700 [Bacilli bacterium]
MNIYFRNCSFVPRKRSSRTGCAADIAAECERCDRELRRRPIDFQFLGIGINGYIGFDEPDSFGSGKHPQCAGITMNTVSVFAAPF